MVINQSSLIFSVPTFLTLGFQIFVASMRCTLGLLYLLSLSSEDMHFLCALLPRASIMLLATGSPNLPSSCHVESEFGTADLQTPPGVEVGSRSRCSSFQLLLAFLSCLHGQHPTHPILAMSSSKLHPRPKFE